MKYRRRRAAVVRTDLSDTKFGELSVKDTTCRIVTSFIVGGLLATHMCTRRRFLAATAASTTVGSIAGCLGADQTTLQYSHSVAAEDVPLGTFSQDFAELVDEKTDESIEIDVYPGGELGGTAESIEGVMTGTIDMTLNPHDVVDSDFGVIAFPYLYDTYDELVDKTDPYESDVASELNEQSIEEYDFRAVTYLASGNRDFHMIGDEGYTPDHFDGADLRAPESEYFVTMIEAMGPSPVAMDFSEVSTALGTGQIEGVEFYTGVVEGAGLYEQIDYITRTNHTKYPMVLGINEETYQGLNDDEQEAIIEAGREAREQAVEDIIADEEENLDIAEDMGVSVIDEDDGLDRSEFSDLVRPAMLDAFPEWEDHLDRLEE